MNELPLVTVIIPLYNAQQYIEQTIKSVLKQTWKNIELIIVDDGSTDNSGEIALRHKGDNVKILRQDNQGASAAKQYGLSEAKGQYIQYLDADDLLGEQKIEKQVKSLMADPDKVAICKTVHFFFNDTANVIADDDCFFTAYLDEPLNFLIKLYGGFDLKGGMIQPNAFLTPRHIIEKAGPWNKEISPCTDEDGEYFARVILKSKGIIYNPEVLNYYRKTTDKGSLSGKLNKVTCANLIKSIWLKHLHMLAFATTPQQLTYIHNATYRTFEQLKLQVYLDLDERVSEIEGLQQELSPSIKPMYQKVGGNAINAVSALFGWKAAKRLQKLKNGLSGK